MPLRSAAHAAMLYAHAAEHGVMRHQRLRGRTGPTSCAAAALTPAGKIMKNDRR